MKNIFILFNTNSFRHFEYNHICDLLLKIKMRVILYILVILIPTTALAKRKVTGEEFRKILISQSVIKDLEIINPEMHTVSEYNKNEMQEIKGDRLIENCIFNNYYFHLLNISGTLIIKDCFFDSHREYSSDNSISFYKSKLHKGLFLIDCKTDSSRCVLNMDECSVGDVVILNGSINSGSHKSLIQQSLNSEFSEHYGSISLNGSSQPISLTLNYCGIFKPIYSVFLGSCHSIKDLWFYKSTFFGPVSLDNLECSEPICIEKCSFHNDVSLSGFRFDMNKSYIDTDSIINKIGYIEQGYYGDQYFHIGSEKIYAPQLIISKDTLDNLHVNFKINIKNSYRLLISYLRSLNKKEEADYGYFKLKKYEQALYWEMLKKDKSNPKKIINVFVSFVHGWYSKFSTDFVKAVINTIIIILFFSLIFLSCGKPYSGRIICRFYFYKMFLNRNIINDEIYSRWQHKLVILEKHKELKTFRSKYKTHKRKIWGLFKSIFHKIIISIATSINFFVTLGYGGLQAKNEMKYIAVIEGLVGWFVLILFTSCLLNNYIDIT